jgi:hypothetical protein
LELLEEEGVPDGDSGTRITSDQSFLTSAQPWDWHRQLVLGQDADAVRRKYRCDPIREGLKHLRCFVTHPAAEVRLEVDRVTVKIENAVPELGEDLAAIIGLFHVVELHQRHRRQHGDRHRASDSSGPLDSHRTLLVLDHVFCFVMEAFVLERQEHQKVRPRVLDVARWIFRRVSLVVPHGASIRRSFVQQQGTVDRCEFLLEARICRPKSISSASAGSSAIPSGKALRIRRARSGGIRWRARVGWLVGR